MSISILIVDSSALVRQVLAEELGRQSDLEVVGTASDPSFAAEKMKANWPDVIVLDIEMPKGNGFEFLQATMRSRPTPILVFSSQVGSGSEMGSRSLSAGAIAIIEKPEVGLRDFLKENSNRFIEVIHSAISSRADRAKPNSISTHDASSFTEKLSADHVLAAPVANSRIPKTDRIVAIGCSTGGTQALEIVLSALPRESPGIVVVQHMPETFTRGFADRLNRTSKIEVKEAETGDLVLPGRALIAPGGRHLLVQRAGQQYRVEVKEGPQVSRHCPSVDVLFRSVANVAGHNATGFIMTGMGDDGAHGMREMHDAGAKCYAQDEESCVVFGMPKEAIRLGGVHHVIPLDRIADIIESIYVTQNWGR